MPCVIERFKVNYDDVYKNESIFCDVSVIVCDHDGNLINDMVKFG